MKRFCIAMTILLSSVAWESQAQTAAKGFFSLHLGTFTSDHPHFADNYGSSTGFAFGAGLGFPVVDQLRIYGKLIYFAKSNEGNSKEFTQWIVNFGLQYDFPVSEDISLAIQGGPTYSNSTEIWSGPSGSSSIAEGKGIVGFFAGIGVEKTLAETPFALFGEAQYVFTRNDITVVVGKYGGFNACVGLRYYFQDRRKQ